MALDARKFDVSVNSNHNRTNRNKQHMRENLTARTCLMGLDARKFSCAKISTFTVTNFPGITLPLQQLGVASSRTTLIC